MPWPAASLQGSAELPSAGLGGWTGAEPKISESAGNLRERGGFLLRWPLADMLFLTSDAMRLHQNVVLTSNPNSSPSSSVTAVVVMKERWDMRTSRTRNTSPDRAPLPRPSTWSHDSHMTLPVEPHTTQLHVKF